MVWISTGQHTKGNLLRLPDLALYMLAMVYDVLSNLLDIYTLTTVSVE